MPLNEESVSKTIWAFIGCCGKSLKRWGDMFSPAKYRRYQKSNLLLLHRGSCRHWLCFRLCPSLDAAHEGFLMVSSQIIFIERLVSSWMHKWSVFKVNRAAIIDGRHGFDPRLIQKNKFKNSIHSLLILDGSFKNIMWAEVCYWNNKLGFDSRER